MVNFLTLTGLAVLSLLGFATLTFITLWYKLKKLKKDVPEDIKLPPKIEGGDTNAPKKQNTKKGSRKKPSTSTRQSKSSDQETGTGESGSDQHGSELQGDGDPDEREQLPSPSDQHTTPDPAEPKKRRVLIRKPRS